MKDREKGYNWSKGGSKGLYLEKGAFHGVTPWENGVPGGYTPGKGGYSSLIFAFYTQFFLKKMKKEPYVLNLPLNDH